MPLLCTSYLVASSACNYNYLPPASIILGAALGPGLCQSGSVRNSQLIWSLAHSRCPIIAEWCLGQMTEGQRTEGQRKWLGGVSHPPTSRRHHQVSESRTANPGTGLESPLRLRLGRLFFKSGTEMLSVVTGCLGLCTCPQEDPTQSVLAHVPSRAWLRIRKRAATLAINRTTHLFVSTLCPAHFPKAFAVAYRMNTERERNLLTGKTQLR